MKTWCIILLPTPFSLLRNASGQKGCRACFLCLPSLCHIDVHVVTMFLSYSRLQEKRFVAALFNRVTDCSHLFRYWLQCAYGCAVGSCVMQLLNIWESASLSRRDIEWWKKGQDVLPSSMPRGSRITLFESYLYFLLLLHFILHHICQSTMSTKCRDIPQNLINQEAKNCHVSTQHLETLTFEAVITMSVLRAGCLAICTLRTNEFFYWTDQNCWGPATSALRGLSARSRAHASDLFP